MSRAHRLAPRLLGANLDDEDTVESDQTEVVEKDGSGGESKDDGR
jgi:hypothetical protein